MRSADGIADISAEQLQLNLDQAVLGRLAGIARHARHRGAIEVLDAVQITRERGLDGDWRGSRRPGANRRQVSLMEAASWTAATGELGLDLPLDLPWWQRRANLLVEGLKLPRRPGLRIRVGGDCLIEVTMECNPCQRMEELAPGLFDALSSDWRGGVLGRVIAPGTVRLGDTIGIEI